MSDTKNLTVRIKEAEVKYGEWLFRIQKEWFSNDYNVYLKHESWTDSTKIDRKFPTYEEAYQFVKEYSEEVEKMSKKNEEKLTLEKPRVKKIKKI